MKLNFYIWNKAIHRCNFLYLPEPFSVTNCYAGRTHAYAKPSQQIDKQ